MFFKHGDHKAHLYRCWIGIRQRCNNPKCNTYKYYGEKGIEFYTPWESYLEFKGWAMDNGYEEGLSIDRIDPKGNYTPSNCRWVTVGENTSNNLNYHYKRGTGQFSKESISKRNKSNREVNGKPISLAKCGTTLTFETISDAAECLSVSEGRDKENCRKNLSQALSPKRNRRSVYGYLILNEDAA